jgi:LysR family nitrogen assimilation transcriptional regulator
VPASRAIIQAQILRNQINPSPTLEIDSLNAMRVALEAGLGCAILARATIASALAVGTIHARRIVAPALTRELHIISLADRPKTRAFAEVRGALVEVVHKEVDCGRWQAKAIRRPTVQPAI